MFKEFASAASKDYKAKFRQLSFNLKDPKNPDLRRSVLSGETEAAELLKMDAEELGSSERRRANQQIREHAMWECERGQATMVRRRARASKRTPRAVVMMRRAFAFASLSCAALSAAQAAFPEWWPRARALEE